MSIRFSSVVGNLAGNPGAHFWVGRRLCYQVFNLLFFLPRIALGILCACVRACTPPCLCAFMCARVCVWFVRE